MAMASPPFFFAVLATLGLSVCGWASELCAQVGGCPTGRSLLQTRGIAEVSDDFQVGDRQHEHSPKRRGGKRRKQGNGWKRGKKQTTGKNPGSKRGKLRSKQGSGQDNGQSEGCVDTLGITDPKPWSDFVSCADELSSCVDNTVVQQGCRATCGLCGGTTAKPSQDEDEDDEAVTAPTTTSPASGAGCSDDCKDATWLQCSSSVCSWGSQYCPCSCGLCGQSITCTCSDPNGLPATSFKDGCIADGADECVCKEGYRRCSYDEELAGTCRDGECVPFHCTCDAANHESMGSFSDVAIDAVGPACWQDKRGGCLKKCSSEDCDMEFPIFKGADASQQCGGIAKGILGTGCCAPAECCTAATSEQTWSDGQQPIPVDFVVFKRSKANRLFSWDEYDSNHEFVAKHTYPAPACEDVTGADTPCSSGLPWSTSNIGGSDGCSGFCRAVALPKSLPFNGTALEHCNNPFDFDRGIAELTVVDLNNDFSQLGEDLGPTFVMGDYTVVEGDTALGSIDDLIALTEGDGLPGSPTGHDLLYKLHANQDEDDALFPKPGRITFWIPNTAIVASTECYNKTTWQRVQHNAEQEESGEILCVGMQLLGSTFLDMSLSSSSSEGPAKGPGAIMAGECQRRGHRYSHELGHIVGFEHASGRAADGVNLMGGSSNQKPTPQFTFTAGAAAGAEPESSYPSIFRAWRGRWQQDKVPEGEITEAEKGPDPAQAEEHESLLAKAAKRSEVTHDAFMRCGKVQAKYGKDVLDQLLKIGKLRCVP
eukprot:TRINITY_DN94431_c0_g1_i1.p1 TRINITY_DN94431_c0_g1~~TRINITY_DN94431_c0_g1_i1.p1  ORF type:complete len:766 (+),score=136.99 TRINITY_DN94431_c0_g1_i1:54-2351(+)